MANDSRAWQRSLKNGKTQAYACVNGNSIRLTGDGDVVRDVLAAFAIKLGATLDFGPPAIIEGQTDLCEQLGISA